MFGVLPGNVQLEQDVDRARVRHGALLEFVKQAIAVHRMHQVHERGDVFDLVGLQVTDEVPFDVGRQQGLFVAQLLGIILSEAPLPQVVQCLDLRHGPGLAHGDQLHVGRDGRLDLFIARSQFVAGEQLGRLVYGLELQPEFVAVILERLAGMGLQPALVEDE